MTLWQRRVRAALGMGLTWAVAGIIAGGVLARLPGFSSDVPFSILFAQFGFVSGVFFSAVLVAATRRRHIGNLSFGRFATWGAASGLLFSSIFVVGTALRGGNVLADLLLFSPALAIAGAVCATGTLAIARRGNARLLTEPRDDDAELNAGEDPRLLDRVE